MKLTNDKMAYKYVRSFSCDPVPIFVLIFVLILILMFIVIPAAPRSPHSAPWLSIAADGLDRAFLESGRAGRLLGGISGLVIDVTTASRVVAPEI